MPRIPRFPFSKSIFAVLCAASACALGDARPSAAQTVDESGRPDSMLVYAADLEVYPERYARADQILVFGMDSDRNIGRFRLKEGIHRFCLEGGAGYFTGIVLKTDRGAAWPSTPEGKGCLRAELPAGIISVVLQHGDRARPDSGVTATVRVDPPFQALNTPLNTPLTDAKNSPIGGYWLIQDTALNARGTLGRALRYDAFDQAVSLTPISQALDQSFLFGFPPADGSYRSATLPAPETEFALAEGQQIFLVMCPHEDCFPAGTVYGSPPPKLQLRDLGNYLFELDGKIGEYDYGFHAVDNILFGVGTEGEAFQVLFRYYEDGSKVGDLRPGEVAVYEQCDFLGRAAVLVPSLGPGQVSPPFDLRSLTSSWWSLNGTLRSVRLGKGAGVYWGADPEHLGGGLIKDNACLSRSPENNLYVEPESNVFTVAHSVLPRACTQCDFSGLPLQSSTEPIDFDLWDLTGARFVGVDMKNVQFTGATLTGAKFTGSMLSHVYFNFVQAAAGSVDLSGTLLYKDGFTPTGRDAFSFSNARFCGVSLNGAGPSQTLDLTTGAFNNALVQLGGDCDTDADGFAVDLSYSTFNLDVPALAERGRDWGAVNLTGATVNSPAGTVLSSQQTPLLLGKARLAGVSMNGVVLDYAQGLTNKDLTGVSFKGSTLRHTVFKGARLYSARLQDSNLEAADLSSAYLTPKPLVMSAGAQLKGAYLFNANLTNAQLSGADFTNASFYGGLDTESDGCTVYDDGTTENCATAAGAIIDDTTFSGAYLYGVDFSNSTGQGVNFSNAYLVGSNFTNASFNDSSSEHTTFYGAFLQGADFSSTTFGAATSFLSAYFDFSANGNTLTYPLPNHTAFAGYWGSTKEPVCVAMIYSQPSQVPSLAGGSACPDGTPVAGSCGNPLDTHSHWNSNAPLGSDYTYASTATYYPAATPACTSDPQWNYGPGQTQRPEKTTGEQR